MKWESGIHRLISYDVKISFDYFSNSVMSKCKRMKRIDSLLVFLFALLITSSAFAVVPGNDKKAKKDGEGHEIKVKINHVNDSLCYLYHHYGDKQRAVDTVARQKDGSYIFSGNEKLDGGIYIVYIPEKVYFEIIVNEQKFQIETDTGDFISNMKITGSEENRIFNEYQKFRKVQFEKQKTIKDELDKIKGDAKLKKQKEDELRNLGKEIEDYSQKIIDNNPDLFFAKVLSMTKPITIPDPPKDDKGNIIDSSFQLRYNQKHFFDNIDFSDDRVLRTPIFHQKIEDYMKHLTLPHPDSLIKAIDFILDKTKASDELFRYTLATMYNKYNTSKIMGYDAVFVHISEKYYISGEAYWADSTFIADITKRVRELTPTLIGEKAKNITLVDTMLQRIPLYSINAKYTVLFFYEPDCGHCKKATPKVLDLYHEFQGLGVEVYSVCTKTDIDEWKEFIIEYETDWINVADPYHQSNFRNFYDVKSTPILYLLDQDKTIIAKRLSPEQMKKMLAEKLGVELPEEDPPSEEDKEKEKDSKH